MWLTLIVADILQPTVFVSQDPGNATISALGATEQVTFRPIDRVATMPCVSFGSLPAREGF
jgi:hypothetical protein